jgi:hypothetical protein
MGSLDDDALGSVLGWLWEVEVAALASVCRGWNRVAKRLHENTVTLDLDLDRPAVLRLLSLGITHPWFRRTTRRLTNLKMRNGHCSDTMTKAQMETLCALVQWPGLRVLHMSPDMDPAQLRVLDIALASSKDCRIVDFAIHLGRFGTMSTTYILNQMRSLVWTWMKVAMLPNLVRLEYGAVGVTDLNAELLCEWIQPAVHLTDLTLVMQRATLGVESVQLIAWLVACRKQLPSLERLSIKTSFSSTPAVATALVDLLTAKPALHTLRLSDASIKTSFPSMPGVATALSDDYSGQLDIIHTHAVVRQPGAFADFGANSMWWLGTWRKILHCRSTTLRTIRTPYTADPTSGTPDDYPFAQWYQWTEAMRERTLPGRLYRPFESLRNWQPSQ